MTPRERFKAIMSYEDFDRLPVWYFGYWDETLARWQKEGLEKDADIASVTGMDPDWEEGLWNIHKLTNMRPIPTEKCDRVLEETSTYTIMQTSLGETIKIGKQGSSPPHFIEYALKPTRESWEHFKHFIDPNTPARRPQGWEAKAEALNNRQDVACFLGGSLYGWLRDWLGVEELSYFMYDDPDLFEEIVDTVTEYIMSVTGPVLRKVNFDFAYIFEDCCFNTGPLFSPDIYKRIYDKYYRRLVDFYHKMGINFVLLDSDGKVDDLVQCWIDSGIDIFFPIEVGTWNADPLAFRKRYGKQMRIMGGVNKHVIPKGAEAIREHLVRLKPLVDEGGYIPLPDHRIPPDCSLEAFKTYVRVFKEVFAR